MKKLALTLVALLLLVLPATSAAAPRPSVGATPGVRAVVDSKGYIQLVFGPKADRRWRQIANRLIWVGCTRMGNTSGLSSGGSLEIRAPKRGRRINTGERAGKVDYCRVELARGGTDKGDVVASAALTPRGANFLDEEGKAAELMALLLIRATAPLQKSPEPLSADALVNLLKHRSPLTREGLIVLNAPSDTPPPGTFGIYADGPDRAAAVVVSKAGRRLFIENDVDDVLRTNVYSYLSDLY